jgi:ankyrin repeat protein
MKKAEFKIMKNKLRELAVIAVTLLLVLSIACKKKHTLGFTSEVRDAIVQGHPLALKALLDAGVDPDAKDADGEAPLTVAAGTTVL